MVSDEKAPISLKSLQMTMAYKRCGEARDHGAGRSTHVRRMYSFITGVGKSGTCVVEGGVAMGESASSSLDMLLV